MEFFLKLLTNSKCGLIFFDVSLHTIVILYNEQLTGKDEQTSSEREEKSLQNY